LTWAEGTDEGTGSRHPLQLVVEPAVHPATIADGSYDHYSLLRSIERRFGRQSLAREERGAAAGQPPTARQPV
jgi:hypothetical protein